MQLSKQKILSIYKYTLLAMCTLLVISLFAKNWMLEDKLKKQTIEIEQYQKVIKIQQDTITKLRLK